MLLLLSSPSKINAVSHSTSATLVRTVYISHTASAHLRATISTTHRTFATLRTGRLGGVFGESVFVEPIINVWE